MGRKTRVEGKWMTPTVGCNKPNDQITLHRINVDEWKDFPMVNGSLNSPKAPLLWWNGLY